MIRTGVVCETLTTVAACRWSNKRKDQETQWEVAIKFAVLESPQMTATSCETNNSDGNTRKSAHINVGFLREPVATAATCKDTAKGDIWNKSQVQSWNTKMEQLKSRSEATPGTRKSLSWGQLWSRSRRAHSRTTQLRPATCNAEIFGWGTRKLGLRSVAQCAPTTIIV